MEIIKGKFAEAKVFSNDLEQYARAQLQMICDNEVAKGGVTEPGTRKIISTRTFGDCSGCIRIYPTKSIEQMFDGIYTFICSYGILWFEINAIYVYIKRYLQL